MDITLFAGLAKMTQPKLTKCMGKLLIDKYGEDKVIFYKGNIYAKGDIPITLIAHLDTVFKHPPFDVYYDSQQKVVWSPDGLGADDRAGIYAITKIIQSGLRPSILLCRDEELGCLGATTFVEKYKTPPIKTNYLIELDRRGSNDCVFYDTDIPAFKKYIESFGYVTASGTYSDVLEIGSTWKIPGVNLSVGYYNEHSVSEILNTDELECTIAKVINMLTQDIIPTFEYIPKRSVNNCALCGQHMTIFEDYMVRTFDSKTPYIHVCPTCLGTSDKIKYCEMCQNPYVGDEICCPKCLEELLKNVGA